MINPEIKRLLKEHNNLINERMNIIDKELKLNDDKYYFNFKEDIELRLHELAITLLEKQGFPFGTYRIKIQNYNRGVLLKFNFNLEKRRYLTSKMYRRKLWSGVEFLGNFQSHTKTILSLLGSSFIKLVLECNEYISEIVEKRLKIMEEININSNFKVDVIENLDVTQRECKSIEFRLGETANNISFDFDDIYHGAYGADNNAFLNDKVYNTILEKIEEKKIEIQKFLKLRKMYMKEMHSHINEPYLGMLGLE